MEEYCHYYQAQVDKSSCWFVLATLKSYEHITFDRTLENDNGTLEFFVPQSTKPYFLEIMKSLENEQVIWNLQEMSNRLRS